MKITNHAFSGRIYVALMFSLLLPTFELRADHFENLPAFKGRFNRLIVDRMDGKRSREIFELRTSVRNGMDKTYIVRFVGAKPRQVAQSTLPGDAEVTVAPDKKVGRVLYVRAPGDSHRFQTSAVELSAELLVGTRSLLAIIVNLTDSQLNCSPAQVNATLFDPANSVDSVYRESSFGALGFSGDVIGPFTINHSLSNGCNYGTWGQAADTLALSAGIDLAQYQHVQYYIPLDSPCAWSGVATLPGSRSYIRSCSRWVPAHELGHNIGMNHASAGTVEYGDHSDAMGNGGDKNFNAPHMSQMGWLPAEKVQTISQGGTYSLAALFADPHATLRPQVLRIADPKDSTNFYYLSYRDLSGYSATLSSTYALKTNVHTQRNSVTVLGGTARTYFQSALIDGASFTESSGAFTVKQLSRDATGPALQITFGAPVPTLTPTPTPTVPTCLSGLIPSIQGDYNRDGCVDSQDEALWRSQSGRCVEPLGAASDGSPDGIIDAGDWTVWKKNVGHGCSTATPTPTSTATPAPDKSPPVTTITSPLNGATVTRGATITIGASAVDNIAVTQVQFLVNGSLTCTDTNQPYTCAWKVPKSPGKIYTLQSNAKDAAGNLGVSALVQVISD
jgi:hypothetical protein